MSTLLDNSIL